MPLKVLLLKKIDRLIGALLCQLLPRPAQVDSFSFKSSRLLIIRPGGIGDAVLLIPVIKHLRQLFPEASIDVLAEKRNGGVFALCSCIDRVLHYDKPRELWAALTGNYDIVIDSEQYHRLSAVVARVARSRLKIGFGTNERKRLFTHQIDYSHENYEQESFLDLLKPLDIEHDVLIPGPYLEIPEVYKTSAENKLGHLIGKPFIVMFPGASISERCWPTENFHQLAHRFSVAGIAVVVVGGNEDVATGNAIVAGNRALNLAGKTNICETASVLNCSQLLVSSDSGVLHLAVGLGVPTISMFGPGIPDKWAPRGKGHVIINHELSCSPCTRFGMTPPCPIGAKCIRDISVDEVYMATQKLLILTQGKNSIDVI